MLVLYTINYNLVISVMSKIYSEIVIGCLTVLYHEGYIPHPTILIFFEERKVIIILNSAALIIDKLY